VIGPGSYDALSTRVAEKAGFAVVRLCGFAMTASLLGRPDVGLLGEFPRWSTTRGASCGQSECGLGFALILFHSGSVSVTTEALRSVSN
jgi:hypothetical protein